MSNLPAKNYLCFYFCKDLYRFRSLSNAEYLALCTTSDHFLKVDFFFSVMFYFLVIVQKVFFQIIFNSYTPNDYFRGKKASLEGMLAGLKLRAWARVSQARLTAPQDGEPGLGQEWGVPEGSKAFSISGRGSQSPRQERFPAKTQKYGPSWSDGTAPPGAATAERTLKWRPWGRRAGETAQQTLAASQAAPSSRSPAQPGLPARPARARPGPPPELLSLAPAAPRPPRAAEPGQGHGGTSREWPKAEASPSRSSPQWLGTALSTYKRALYTVVPFLPGF